MTVAATAETGANGDRVYDHGGTPTADEILLQSGRVHHAKAERLRDLERWLRQHFEESLTDTLTKANGYGSGDIEIMGRAFGPLLPMRTVDLSNEAVIAFYCLGKLSRILGAIQDGQVPTADSWLDLRIYATMGEKIHDTGHWM